MGRPHLAHIILAAGESQRLGSPKQLLGWNGSSLLRHAIQRAHEVASTLQLETSIIVVLGAFYEQLKAHVESVDCAIIFNEQWNSGMASSIASGVGAANSLGAHAYLFSCCDQPMITVADYAKLISAYVADQEITISKSNKNHSRDYHSVATKSGKSSPRNSRRIVASSYDKTFGTPAVFSVHYSEELLRLSGHQGAKSVIAHHIDECLFVACDRAQIDIDTQEDYEKVRRAEGANNAID